MATPVRTDFWLSLVRFAVLGGVSSLGAFSYCESLDAAGPRVEARRQARIAAQQGFPAGPIQPAGPMYPPGPYSPAMPYTTIDPWSGLPVMVTPQPYATPMNLGGGWVAGPTVTPLDSNTSGFAPTWPPSNSGSMNPGPSYPGSNFNPSNPAPTWRSQGMPSPAGPTQVYPSPSSTSEGQSFPSNPTVPTTRPVANRDVRPLNIAIQTSQGVAPRQLAPATNGTSVTVDPYTGVVISTQIVPVQAQSRAMAQNQPGGTQPGLTPIPDRGNGGPPAPGVGPGNPDNRNLTPAQRRRMERQQRQQNPDIASRTGGDRSPSMSVSDGPTLGPPVNGPALPGVTPVPEPMGEAAGYPPENNPGNNPTIGSNPANNAFPPVADNAQIPIGPSVEAPFQVYVVLQEKFINRFVAQTKKEPGPVRDFILGAEVYGEQETTSHAWLNLLPSADSARGQFVLEGSGQVRSTGFTSQAAVSTQGVQEFRGVKDVLFDGLKLATRAAVIQAKAHNTPVSAQTAYSNRPLIGPIAERIAMGVAQRQQAQVDIIARDRVAERVFESFNREVDKELANANGELKQLQEKLEDLTLMPSVQKWSSSHAHLQFAGQFGADAPVLSPMPTEARQDHALTVFLHETVLNRAADRANLRGYVTSDKELKDLAKWLRDLVPGAGAMPMPAAPNPLGNVETKIVFDSETPLRFQIDGDLLKIILKAQFQPGGQAILPQMEVTIPARLEIDKDTVHLVFDKIEVKSLTNERTATLGMAEGMVRQSIQANFPRLSLPRQLPPELWNRSGTPPSFNYARAADGWLGVGFD